MWCEEFTVQRDRQCISVPGHQASFLGAASVEVVRWNSARLDCALGQPVKGTEGTGQSSGLLWKHPCIEPFHSRCFDRAVLPLLLQPELGSLSSICLLHSFRDRHQLRGRSTREGYHSRANARAFDSQRSLSSLSNDSRQRDRVVHSDFDVIYLVVSDVRPSSFFRFDVSSRFEK